MSQPVLGVTGWKNSGKTTLVERLVAELVRRGRRVSTVKHAHHDFDIDKPGEAGVWMIQQGYASGPAEITVGTMTTVDPFVAVVFGLVVLGEGMGMGVGPMIGMVVTGAIAVYGVAMLSKDHPDAIEERRRAEAAIANADA